jgi:cephalosporin hydroxylase
MENILDILIRNNINGFGTNGGTDKATDHSYNIIYDEIFSEYREKEISVLEIGVQWGGSALLWHEFFPKAKLVLVDIQDQVHPSIWDKMDIKRYDYHICDAFTNETVETFKVQYPEGFDIIIEDGPHTLESQIFTIQNYVPILNNGGVLIIEDVQRFEDTESILKSIGDLEHISCNLIDIRHVKGRYDDLMIVVKK